MQNTKEELNPGSYYHIFNRAIGSEKVFKTAGNYDFFIERYMRYIHPIADTFCYCLMPNHFHFLIRIKEEKDILNYFGENLKKPIVNNQIPETLPYEFGKFFNSYVKAFNNQQNRKGSLFIKHFKRKFVSDEKYLLKLVHYVHQNPIEAGICSMPEDYIYSSFNILISENKTFLKREEVIGWFENKENFIYVHRLPPEVTGIN